MPKHANMDGYSHTQSPSGKQAPGGGGESAIDEITRLNARVRQLETQLEKEKKVPAPANIANKRMGLERDSAFQSSINS